MEQMKETIKNFMFLKDLCDMERIPFLKVMKRKKYTDKSIIFRYDYPITHVYFVASGKVKVYRNDFAGKEQIMSLEQQGDMFPQVGFFRKAEYPFNAQVIGETELYVISIQDFEEILFTNPYLAIKLCSVMGDRIVYFQRILEEVKLRSTNEKILLLLLRLCEAHGSVQPDGWVRLNTRFTNLELANMIGTSRESVNRMISRLRKEEAIKLVSGNYCIYLEKVKDELIA